jgi:hypothetical protein
MLKFTLVDDLTVDGLRKLADLYGVPKAVTLKPDLITALQGRMATGDEVVLGQATKAWYRTPTVMVSIVSVLIAIGAMAASWYNVSNTVSKELAEKRKGAMLDWQRVVVYKIIEAGTKDKDKDNDGSMSFETIRQQYVTEAAAADGISLPKGELQPWSLRRILLDLIMTQAVYQSHDDKYCIQRSYTNPRAGRTFLEEQANYTILNLLSREGGKHDFLELGQIVTDKLKITNEEYNSIMNQLMASNLVLVGLNKKLYSIASIPRGKAVKD